MKHTFKHFVTYCNITGLLWLFNSTGYCSVNPTTPSFLPSASQEKVGKLSYQELLAHLIQAELAASRHQYATALDNYMIVAAHTLDPEIAQLATEYAIELQAYSQALTAAELWAEAAPTQLQAQLVAVTLLIKASPEKSLKYLNRAFELQTPGIDQHLLTIYGKLSQENRENLTSLVFKLSETRTQDAQAHLAAAQLAAIQLDVKRAQIKLQQTFAIVPQLTEAIELQAKLIRHQHNQDSPALTYLESELNKNPNNSKLRLFYTSALLDNQLVSRAIPELELLTKDTTYAGNAWVLLGEIQLSQKNLSQAKETLKNALPFEDSSDNAKYYLAQIAEVQEQLPQAIQWYRQISEHNQHHITAQLQAAFLLSLQKEYAQAINLLREAHPKTLTEQKQLLLSEIDILIEQKQLEQAIQTSSQALNVLPNDIDFLYARSLASGQLNLYHDTEKDLLLILSQEPNHTNALNALGYTLSKQPDRLKDALPYLEKAMVLSPNNPAIMDSMGWLLYRMGELPNALDILKTAYQLSQDTEIAMHFAEVLWQTGDKDQAKKIWKKVLANNPSHDTIHHTLERLNIPLEDIRSMPAKIKAHNP